MTNPFDETHTGTSDETLAAAARAGDREALEQLLARHQPWILNIAFRMVRRRAEAEDATQEILVKIWKALPGYRGDSAFRTWLYRIAVNHILDLRRGWDVSAPRRSFAERDLALADMPDQDLPDPRTVPVPVEILVEEAKIGCTMGVLLCLDGRQRLVFILGEILSATDAIGAEIVGVTPANFRQILSRARRDLNHYLNGSCSLVNPGSACKCARKTRAFMDKGYLVPDKLQFTVDYQRRIRDVVKRRAGELAEAHVAFEPGVFRDHPFFESGDPVAAVRKALAALSPDFLP